MTNHATYSSVITRRLSNLQLGRTSDHDLVVIGIDHDTTITVRPAPTFADDPLAVVIHDVAYADHLQVRVDVSGTSPVATTVIDFDQLDQLIRELTALRQVLEEATIR